jgi:KipI family sensor histidine kinase inhibitor
VAVHYDGPDLDLAAALLGLSGSVLVERHTEQVWRVAMMGFAPGFGYLVPEGTWRADWAALARRDDPRPAVPGGSVAIAAGMSAVYPARMPGGWHLIGRTDATVFDVDRAEPALLAPDDIVRFRDAAR